VLDYLVTSKVRRRLLTGELGGDRRLRRLAETLRDRRVTSQRDFFLSTRRGGLVRDFPTAARWGFRFEVFRTLFAKFEKLQTGR
jgi:hypothetical protein